MLPIDNLNSNSSSLVITTSNSSLHITFTNIFAMICLFNFCCTAIENNCSHSLTIISLPPYKYNHLFIKEFVIIAYSQPASIITYSLSSGTSLNLTGMIIHRPISFLIVRGIFTPSGWYVMATSPSLIIPYVMSIKLIL